MNGLSYSLPIGETLKSSWSKISGSKATLWTAILIWVCITIGLAIIDQVILSLAPKIEPLFNIILAIVGILIDMGIMFLGIRRAQDLPISPGLMFNTFKGSMPLKIIGLYILQFLICLLPILAIIGGVLLFRMLPSDILAIFLSTLVFLIGTLAIIYLSIRLSLSMAFVLDKQTGPVNAIKFSFRATQSNFWRLIIIFFLQSVFLLLFFIPLVVAALCGLPSLILLICAIPILGLIWSIPFAMINYGNVYKHLAMNNMGKSDPFPQ